MTYVAALLEFAQEDKIRKGSSTKVRRRQKKNLAGSLSISTPFVPFFVLFASFVVPGSKCLLGKQDITPLQCRERMGAAFFPSRNGICRKE
jgi:hypothetical protein